MTIDYILYIYYKNNIIQNLQLEYGNINIYIFY